MNWQEELKKTGLSVNDFSEKIKKLISAYQKIEMDINTEDDDDRKSEMEDLINELNETLCKEIPKYAKNKDRYDALGKKMAEARNAKKASGGTVKTATTAAQTQTATPAAQTQTATPAAQTQTATPVTPKPNTEIEEKKSGGLGTVLLAIGAIGGIALAVATFGKYNPFKK